MNRGELLGVLMMAFALLIPIIMWPLLEIRAQIKRTADAIERLEDERD